MSSWNHQQALVLQFLNVLGILSERKGNNNATGGALQALSLPGFTFRNQPFWNYSMIHLAGLPSPTNCITLMPFSARKKKKRRFQLSENTEGKFSYSPSKLKQNNSRQLSWFCQHVISAQSYCSAVAMAERGNFPESANAKPEQSPLTRRQRSCRAPLRGAPCAEAPRLGVGVPACERGCGDTTPPPHLPFPPCPSASAPQHLLLTNRSQALWLGFWSPGGGRGRRRATSPVTTVCRSSEREVFAPATAPRADLHRHQTRDYKTRSNCLCLNSTEGQGTRKQESENK